VARGLARKFRGRADLLVLEGGSAPENLTGPLIGFEPSHLVVVDCAELDDPPGSVRLFPVESIGGLSSSTHSLPLSVIFGYLRKSTSCEILVVGIRPKSLTFDGKATKEALAAARGVEKALARAIRAMGGRPTSSGRP
jgi:hydrogenase 3 maturation protease